MDEAAPPPSCAPTVRSVVGVRMRLLVCRLMALGVLLTLFYAFDWMPLRVLQRDVIGWSLGLTGYAAEAFVHEGSPAFHVGGYVFFYTAECTYLDLLVIVAPFLWVFGATRRSNMLRIGMAALVILGGNLLRTWASVYFNVRGTDWFYTHDLPDHIICWPAVVIVVLGAVGREFRENRSFSRKPCHSAPAEPVETADALLQA